MLQRHRLRHLLFSRQAWRGRKAGRKGTKERTALLPGRRGGRVLSQNTKQKGWKILKKGDRVNGVIEKMEFPNKGIMTVDGERLVVKNALPGQTVLAAVTKKRKGRGEGRLLEVAEKSPLETAENPCPQSGVCGGCLYQTIPYEEQLKIKEGQVRELLDSVCSGYEFEGIKASPIAEEYRNKMEFSFGDEKKDGPLCLGMHKRGSFYDVVNADECRIVHGDFRKILTVTREYFAGLGAPFYKKLRHEGYLRHLLVRRAVKTGEILVALVTTTQTDWVSGGGGDDTAGTSAAAGEADIAGTAGIAGADGTSGVPAGERQVLDNWKELIRSLPLEGELAGILHVKNDSLADVVQSDETEILYGKDFFYEELLGLRFKISPFSFFQTNSLGAEVLYSKVREYIGDTAGQVVFDLYSGTGTIAQILAPVAEKVVGVEIVEEAVEAARENAARNGLSNCEFIAGDVLKVVGGLEDKPDLIVLDPPRDGVHPKALNQIIDFGVKRMVYVSCKPTSLQRDLVTLQERGYKMERACCVDMFPGTGNCETVVLLSKGEVDSKKIRFEFSLEDMDMSEFQDGATYTQIKDYVLEHSGLKVSNLYISQIKRKCGIEVGKNYNLPKSEDSRQPLCPPEKEKAIREAFKYFGII